MTTTRTTAAAPARHPIGWQTVGATSGGLSRTIAIVQVLLGIIWLTWPVWGSRTAALQTQAESTAPWLVAAQIGVSTALAVILVRETKSARPLSLVLGSSVIAAGVRAALAPGVSGIEPVFWIPLLVGAVLGAPGGVLAGTLTCLVSSAAIGTLATPLAGQLVVWQLWGLAGSAMVRLRALTTWITGALWCLILGPITGLLLNLMGWAWTQADPGQSFLAGLGPIEEAQRLWAWTRATSLAFDMSRAITNSIVWLIVTPFVTRALRQALAPDRRASARVRPIVSTVDDKALGKRNLTGLTNSFPITTHHSGDDDDTPR
ncbi:hypothetical protein O6R08_08330 [Cutibacterium equinum]|uniref:ECF transporter S component n=1 Tax=Cutibacterium equinum TaxID=3016342 RepID=A0ABY7QYJ1_9ACTN|nr:hypothetical protein [Cutibacterium equinum]WCC79514.1 hypothetical protein O6R08_08330 [Cutibacterium equinum]